MSSALHLVIMSFLLNSYDRTIDLISIYHTCKWIVLFAHADWLARRWLAKYYLLLSSRRKTKWLSVSNKPTVWFSSFSACVVYTKTIIHLSVGEKWWNIHHYSPPLRWIIVNYHCREKSHKDFAWRPTCSVWNNPFLYVTKKVAVFHRFKVIIIKYYRLPHDVVTEDLKRIQSGTATDKQKY